MNKVYVIYWSGTGNTMAMASAVVDGARAKCVDAQLWSGDEADINELKNANKLEIA